MLIFDQLKKNDVYLRTLTWTVLGGMLVLLGGLYCVQILSSRHYSENQISQAYRTVRIPSVRGMIMDRNGEVLAENRPSYSLGLYIEELRPLFKAEWKRTRPRASISRQLSLELQAQTRYRVASNIAQRLSQVLRTPIPLDFETFNQHYLTKLALPLPLLENLTDQQIALIEEQPHFSPGVDLAPQAFRSYPHGSLAAHLIGYLSRDDSSARNEDAFFNYRLPDYRGRIGIEGTFDEVLRGRAGAKSVLVNNLGYRQAETIWTPSEPGKNVVLTIDHQVQRAAERALLENGPGTRGACVVMDPRTGNLLAIASAPTFDLNLFIPRISPEDYQVLQDTNQRPQINRAVQENYQPGSIFKPLVGLACLESGLDPESRFYHPGYIYVGSRYINDLAAEGEYDFRRALIKSSNAYFISNGITAGIESILRLGHQLHLGQRTGLPTNQEVPGFFPDQDRLKRGWSDGDTANLCMGQGFIDVTPLQMAVMTAAIANGGDVLKPRVVDRVEPSTRYSDEPVERFREREVVSRLEVNRRSMDIVRAAMLADVEDPEGTGRAVGLPGLRICGKTGTAQITNTRNQVIDQTTWFISFAPYESPRYVVVVMVESGVFGGTTCAPIAQKIYRAILDMEQVPPPLVAGLEGRP